jgi:hypothetical protein
MRAELDADLCGGKYPLALPLGALEDIAEKIEPEVYHLAHRLASGSWKLAEVRGVLDTALGAGGADITAEEVIHEDGLMRAAEVAYLILERALTGPPSKKNKAAPKAKKPKPGS